MPPSTALVAGALANKPHNGGEAWVRLSFALGLRRLGFRVVFIEQIEPAHCSPAAVAFFNEVTTTFGIDCAELLAGDAPVSGRSREQLLGELGEPALLVNISGNLRDVALLERCRRRVYVDVDPGYTQLWHAAGVDVGLAGHHDFVTVGARIGVSGCEVSTAGIAWRHLPPPVVLEEWPVAVCEPGRFTTVGSWRGGYGRVEHGGRVYGQKAHEFRKLRELPRRGGFAFELALDIDPADEADRRGLLESGWHVVDPREVAAGPFGFRDYVQGSGAECSAAQGIYVETRCGWVGDRTVRYLASGKPALVQDTGLDGLLPLGEGLIAFGSCDEAIAGAESIVDGYASHCLAARRLAEELFDSDLVLGRLLEDVGVAP